MSNAKSQTSKPTQCPHCGQRMLMRHGVRLSPKLADIFDMIEHAGERGIDPEVLSSCFYPGKPQAAARSGFPSITSTIFWNRLTSASGCRAAVSLNIAS
jgi:hypothetical protein